MVGPDQSRFHPISPELADKFARFEPSNPSSLTPTERAQREWTRFEEGEIVFIKGVRFRIHEIGESRMVLKFASEQ